MKTEKVWEKAEKTGLCQSEVGALAREMKDFRDAPLLAGRALKEGKTRTATVLLFADCAAGRAPDRDVMLAAFPRISDLTHALALALRVEEDPAGFFLDTFERGACSWEREGMALYAAAFFSPPGPKPGRLLVAIRLLNRFPLGPEAASLLLSAAQICVSRTLQPVHERWAKYAPLAKTVASALPLRSISVKPILEFLPRQPLKEPESPFRSMAASIGRNAPCPCKSGKIFKRCCGSPDVKDGGRLDDTILASLMEIDEFDSLRPDLISVLDLPRLPALHLITAARIFGRYRRWDEAERALASLALKTEMPFGNHADDYREEVLMDALDSGDPAAARKIMAGFTFADKISADAIFELDLLEGKGGLLDKADELARLSIGDEDSLSVNDVAHVLCRRRPALGLFIARALLFTSPSPGEIAGLQDSIEEARDRLLLDPFDIVVDRFETMLFDEDGLVPESPAAPDETVKSLREKTSEADKRIAFLEKELSELRAVADAKPETPPAALAPGAAEPAEVERLREKIETFKARIADGQAERASLRRQLRRLSEASRKGSSEERGEHERVEAEEADDFETETAEKPGRGARIPVFEAQAAEALRAAPEGVAKKALQLAASLCAGEDAAWRGVKKIQSAGELRMARVGLTRRLLFTEGSEGILRFEAFLERRDFETYLRQRR